MKGNIKKSVQQILKQTGITLLLVPSLLFVNTKRAEACSCIQPPPPLTALEQATAVFAGKVTSINQTEPFNLEVTFQVSQAWKGEASSTLVVATPLNSAMCGVYFEIGEEYLVYAYGEENQLSTNLCSRTQLASQAEADLVMLGGGQLPTPECSNRKLRKE
ncbi:MAG: hypothetical protein WA919_21915 [Coleofasciculaceae cyanobacterium]